MPTVIRISDGRRRRRACGGWGYIKLPRWSRKKLWLLHETSHAIFPNWKHWPEMVGVYLWLTESFAPEYAADLHRALRAYSVRAVPFEHTIQKIEAMQTLSL